MLHAETMSQIAEPGGKLLTSQDNSDGAQQSHKPRSRAPKYSVPSRTIAALEHPMIVKDVDKAIKTFGNNPAFSHVSAL